VKQQKTALYILITYIVMQLSAFIFSPLLFIYFNKQADTGEQAILLTSGWWIFISMGIAVVITFIFGYRDKLFFDILKGEKSSILVSIIWGVIGFFMVLIGQSMASMIETALGIEAGSQNTADLISISKVAPVAIFAIAIFAPILEEIIFRRVIFGSLIKPTNFFIAGAVSAIVFAIIHLDFTHILLYAVSGFIFAFLYYKTKRLLTSIIAHMLLNGFVVLVNLNSTKIEQFLEKIQKMQP
jgi:uncharacterized protein